MTPETLTTSNDLLDRDACAREAIRTPGTIQPYGLLLVIEPATGTVVQCAVARAGLLARHGSPLGQPLDQALGGALADTARSLVRTPEAGHAYLGTVTLEGVVHHAVAHRAQGMIQLELEEATPGEPGSLEDLYPLIRAFMGDLERARDTAALCDLAASQLRCITGLDRVLIYRFDEAWNGTVVAEARNEALPSYLDLRFPASDIPPQARELYRLSRLRLISDCDYVPVPIEPALNPATGEPADLSLTVLRSVSPVHLQYMRNMGTGASMSISLLREGRLWGLISCHNRAPHRVPYHVRTACDFLGQILSLQIAAKEHATEVEHRVGRRAIQARLLALMAAEDDFLKGLAAEPGQLLSLTQSDGAALVHQGRCILLGRTPTEAQVRELVRWLDARRRGDEFHTASLPAEVPASMAFKDAASGLLAVSISQMHASYVMWFRPELIHTVRWGGDPRKPPGAATLDPRTSFEAWKETVRLQSLPWSAADVEAATELRTAIVDIVLRKAEEMADLNEQLVRSNKELEAFSYSVSHDLRAPFRHIVGYSELLLQAAGDQLGDREKRFIATIIESANSAGSLVDNLLSFSQMGRSTLGKVRIDMRQLAHEARHLLEVDVGDRAIEWHFGDLPVVEADPMMIRLVLQNLFSNALKFTRGRDPAVIGLNCETVDGEHRFCVCDNGCGFDMRYVGKLFGVFQRLHHTEEFEGTGIGLANVRRIIERHDGRTWATSELGKGASIYFTLPATGETQP
ncbi:ATP-binding protein [Frateuria terrea]|uniref:histidine kinase n=1 Tax=Frateuria terrea TaxID=529704 RepID=A0A1H6R6I7_9GAMM|nr:ATP-binding protein [Frateuria terrea]SEI51343.1 Bacteriophytochrome (light-regulated signal transduction histidine kinase) [Frateuria terrea]SFP16239.1 Bacteriophytochrome (light-regulated signal transduction histidine kinase) [Frateuria terrea]